MMEYDESGLRVRLAPLSRVEKTAFAAACAERLQPLFARYHRVTKQGDPDLLDRILDQTWGVLAGDSIALEQSQVAAEEMVPSDEDHWIYEMGYGQNAAACVAYAVRTWLSNDPQEAVWAARQVYEAADYAAQRSYPELDVNHPDAAGKLLGSPAVQIALTGLLEDLAAAKSGGAAHWEQMRLRAREEGEVWARSVP